MPRQSRGAPISVAEPSYPAWKAAAVKAVQKLHERAAAVTRESIWTRAYILRLSPADAAELAAREYYSTHPPSWVKRRRWPIDDEPAFKVIKERTCAPACSHCRAGWRNGCHILPLTM